MEYYDSHRKNPKYRKKVYERIKKWQHENREHYNALVRAGMKRYHLKIYLYREKHKLCNSCGDKRDSQILKGKMLKNCRKCLNKLRLRR